MNSKKGYQIYLLRYNGADDYVVYLGARDTSEDDSWFCFGILNNLEVIEFSRGKDAYTTDEIKE